MSTLTSLCWASGQSTPRDFSSKSEAITYMTLSPRDEASKQVYVPDFPFGNNRCALYQQKKPQKTQLPPVADFMRKQFTLNTVKALPKLPQSAPAGAKSKQESSAATKKSKVLDGQKIKGRTEGAAASTNSQKATKTAKSSKNNESQAAESDPKASPLPFVESLMQILTRESKRIICWNEGGFSFQILDKKRLEGQILPKYFQHSKYYSFTRQLNYHGFKVVAQSGSNSNAAVYKHEHFTRDNPRLSLIKRKSNKRRAKEATAADKMDESPSPSPPQTPLSDDGSVKEIRENTASVANDTVPVPQLPSRIPSLPPLKKLKVQAANRALSIQNLTSSQSSYADAASDSEEDIPLRTLKRGTTTAFNGQNMPTLTKRQKVPQALALPVAAPKQSIPQGTATPPIRLPSLRMDPGMEVALKSHSFSQNEALPRSKLRQPDGVMPTDRLEALKMALTVLEFCDVA